MLGIKSFQKETVNTLQLTKISYEYFATVAKTKTKKYPTKK